MPTITGLLLLLVAALLFQPHAYAEEEKESGNGISVMADDALPDDVVHTIELPERPSRPEKTDRPAVPTTPERPEPAAKPERPEAVQRPEKPVVPEHPGRR